MKMKKAIALLNIGLSFKKGTKMAISVTWKALLLGLLKRKGSNK